MPTITKPKRGRGRPKGSGIDDDATLGTIADLLVENPDLKPMTAMKRVMGRPDDTLLHRLNRKFREQEPALLAAAKARRDRRKKEQWMTFAKEAFRAFDDTMHSAPELTLADIFNGTFGDPKVQAALESIARATEGLHARLYPDSAMSPDMQHAVRQLERDQADLLESQKLLDDPAIRAQMEALDKSMEPYRLGKPDWE